MAAAVARRRARSSSDAGVTLLEVIVAIAVVGILMTALTSLVGRSVSVTNQQSGQQAAVQIADDALERVRSLHGPELLTGRQRTQVDTQWATPVPGLDRDRVLSGMVKAYDETNPPSATTPLPTTPRDVTVSDRTYQQRWYVGRCWLPATSDVCGTDPSAAEFFRVVVAVTWSDSRCPAGACSFVTSTLVGAVSADPLFTADAGGP